MRRRVAITGMGVVCPLGAHLTTVWSDALAGRSAVAPLTVTNPATGVALTVPAAAVPDRSLRPLAKGTDLMTDKFSRLALIAAQDAIADARIELETIDRSRAGVSSGTCMGGICETDVGFNTIYVKKRPRVHPLTVVRTMYNAPAALISITHHLLGPALCYSTSCSSSSVAIGEAARYIRHGYADVMIAGGTDSVLTYGAVNSWHSAQLLAPLHEDPAKSCRPFDTSRNGTVLGEGAIFVTLEEWDCARARGARIYAELAGYACTADSGHLTQPSSDGQARPMQQAIADAQLRPEDVGYVNAHGTGTKLNDVIETKAIHAAFGKSAKRLAVSSSKAQVGHLVGTAGAFGLLMCVKAVETEQVPPTANLEVVDPQCDLDYVPGRGRAAPGLSAALCNAFGFGGTAATLVVTRAC